MARSVFTGGIALFARPDTDDDQILAVDLTVRPQGPHRTVVLPLSLPRHMADRVQWLAVPDHALFTKLDSLFHPLVQQGDTVERNVAGKPPRLPPKATVAGGIAVGREGLVEAGLTGSTGEVAPDAICVWARVTPPPRPVWVRWLGLNWGWPKAALAIRMPRPDPRCLVFPTRGLARRPAAFGPGPTLYAQAPRPPGPVWRDPDQAPGHPFDWQPQEREGDRPTPVDETWPLFRAFTTERAAYTDVIVELLDRGERPWA